MSGVSPPSDGARGEVAERDDVVIETFATTTSAVGIQRPSTESKDSAGTVAIAFAHRLAATHHERLG
jgi:hypothetical protein